MKKKAFQNKKLYKWEIGKLASLMDIKLQNIFKSIYNLNYMLISIYIYLFQIIPWGDEDGLYAY